MSKATTHEGVRRMRFVSLLDRHGQGEITQAEAAEILGTTVRTFQRWVDRYREEGEEGLADRRIGKPSPRRAPAAEIERMLGLFGDKYSDFTVKHFHQQLKMHHNYTLGYTVTKRGLQDAGLVRVAPQRSAHRKKRAPRPLPGMMLHQDGSRHDWLEGQAPLDLIPDQVRDDAGRCDEPDPVGVPGRGGGHGVDVPWPAGGGRAARLVLLAVYRSRQSLLVYAGGRRQGVESATNAGGTGLGATRHRAHRSLLAGGPRSQRAGIPHTAG